MDKIINNLPNAYKKDLWVQMLMKTAQIQLDELEQNAIQLGYELLLNLTSEKQLQVEEKLCGITSSLSQNIDDRKAVVSSKWKSKGLTTLQVLQAIADSWQDGHTELSYPEAQSIHIKFIEPNGVTKDLQGMYKALRENAPAHIPFTSERVYQHPKAKICIAAVPTFSARILIKPKPKEGT